MMNMNQSQVQFDVLVKRDHERPRKGLLLTGIIAFAVLGLIVGLFLGHSVGVMNVTKHLYPILRPRTDTGVSKRDVADKFINPEETDFSWDIADLTELKFGIFDEPDLGTSIEDVLDKHGKALKGSFQRDRINLEWGELDKDRQEDEDFDYHTVRKINLTFRKAGDSYYLQDISYSGDSQKAKMNPMTSDYYDKLKVGDPKTGKDGISYKEVLKEYAISSLSMSADKAYKTHEIATKMTIRFTTSSSDDYKLVFIKQADGNFLLAKKGDD